VFRNPQGKFDGRIFMGVCLGLGSFAGVVIKLLMSADGNISPFWLWAVPGAIIAVGLSVWLSTRRRDAQIRERIERSRRVERRETDAAE
jgi:hypothetical protein